MKDTLGSGENSVILVEDNGKSDIDQIRRQLSKWLARLINKKNPGREWVYEGNAHRIIAEKFIRSDSQGGLVDCKFFCFNGQPKAMFIASDRGIGETKFDYYDLNFKHLDIIQHYPNSKQKIEKPKNFDKMIELSRVLSKNLIHVRVDFYEVNGQVYFGELTFYHFSGFQPFVPEKWDYKFGEWIDLEIKKEKREKSKWKS